MVLSVHLQRILVHDITFLASGLQSTNRFRIEIFFLALPNLDILNRQRSIIYVCASSIVYAALSYGVDGSNRILLSLTEITPSFSYSKKLNDAHGIIPEATRTTILAGQCVGDVIALPPTSPDPDQNRDQIHSSGASVLLDFQNGIYPTVDCATFTIVW